MQQILAWSQVLRTVLRVATAGACGGVVDYDEPPEASLCPKGLYNFEFENGVQHGSREPKYATACNESLRLVLIRAGLNDGLSLNLTLPTDFIACGTAEDTVSVKGAEGSLPWYARFGDTILHFNTLTGLSRQ